jgi:hypothetical protein
MSGTLHTLEEHSLLLNEERAAHLAAAIKQQQAFLSQGVPPPM